MADRKRSLWVGYNIHCHDLDFRARATLREIPSIGPQLLDNEVSVAGWKITSKSTIPEIMLCGISEIANVGDMVGYACGKTALTICVDCGTHLCDAHAESCEVCDEVFCSTCLAFHTRANHREQQKDMRWVVIADRLKRKRA